MTNYVVLSGWVYVGILLSLGLIGLAFVALGVWMRKIMGYMETLLFTADGISRNVCEQTVINGRLHSGQTTRLVYIKGQLDRVLNEQPVAHNERMAIKKETQEIKTRLTWSKKRENKDLKAESMGASGGNATGVLKSANRGTGKGK